MALTKIADLGNGTGKIYEIRAGKVRQSYANTRDIVEIMLVRAIRSRIIHPQNTGETGAYTEAANDPDASSFWLDSNAGAADLSGQFTSALSADAIDITKYIMLHSKHPAYAETIASGVITAERYAPLTIIRVNPQSGTADDIDSIEGPNFATQERDFQEGDIIMLIPASDSYVITVKNATGGVNGPIRLNGQRDKYLAGPAACIILIKRNGTGWQESGHDDYLQIEQVAANTNYDPITAGSRIYSLNGEVWLNNSGALSATVTIGSATAYKGCRIRVRPKTAYSSYSTGSLTVFGISIPSNVGTTTSWMVEAICNDSGVWTAWLMTGTIPTYVEDGTIVATTANYQNNLLIGKSTKNFVFMLDGAALTFAGSAATASFDTVTGTITFTDAVDADSYYHITIH